MTARLNQVDCLFNRSAYKLLEILTNTDIVPYGRVLDLCGASGGFIQVLSLYNTNVLNVSITDNYYSGARLLADVEIQDIFDLQLDETFDFVVADGAIETSFRDDSIFKREMEITLSVLKENGTFIIKHNNYHDLDRLYLGAVSKYFNRVSVVKPMFSRAGNSKCYIVAQGYT